MTDARSLTQKLNGYWYGYYGVAPCPVCQPEARRDQNALTLSDDHATLLLHCKRAGCAYRDLLAAAGIVTGHYVAADPVFLAQRMKQRDLKVAQRAKIAQRLWEETQPIAGSVAETYLVGRGITCALPDTLRYHPACLHGPTSSRHPALVAKVEGGNAFAIHRTYLLPDGSGKAEINPPKAMLGAVAGGAVRLTDAPGALVVAEGIETSMSLSSGLLREPATIWAALSTSGMRALRLPSDPGHLTIALDGDDAGRAAAIALAERAHAIGWTVSLLPAPDELDWNDVLFIKGEQK